MRNSLKQMMRTPVRTAFFLILMVFAALLNGAADTGFLRGKICLECGDKGL